MEVQWATQLIVVTAIPEAGGRLGADLSPTRARHSGSRAVATSVPRRVAFHMPLETKLHPPPERKEWVGREELIDYLVSVPARLVLVDAPAGSGKTTLVAQWHFSPAESRPFAWVSLDPGDNDPARLWWHVVCALQRACPKLEVDDILGGLRAQSPDIVGRLLPLLVNASAALLDPVVLVLDDYHLIREASCQEQVAFLLLHLPPAIQVVLVTRTDPPLPLARLRAAGELAEIRARELRFGPAQVAELVSAAAGVDLSEPDLADLTRRTEGWPAGVYLVALALRGHQSPSAFIRQFTGDSRFVVDFLAEEVLSQQPAGVRQFLARTSVLSRFCAPLCDAVVGSANAAEIIGILERENLFVVSLDDTRQWFRYHHLFAQVLRSELAQTEPGVVSALHERASAWLDQSGRADEAISHARAAGDTAGAIDLITRNWHAYVGSGRVGTVRGWLSSLGNEVVAAHPAAAHCAAWAAALSGDRESLRRWLPVIEAAEHDGPLPDGVRSLQSSAALLKGTFGFEGIRPMRDAAAVAITLEQDPASPWHALALLAYASALYWSGDLDTAAAHGERALAAPGSDGIIRAVASAILSLVALDEARVDQAEQLARSARDIVADAGSRLAAAPQSALAYAAVGAALARRGLLAEARQELEHALRAQRSQSGVSPWATVEILVRLAPVRADTGDLPGAIALAEEARQVLTSSPGGASILLARLERLEQRLASRSRKAAPAEPLTHREVAVLRLLSGTLSLREIGQELYLSQNTIKTHTQAIYRKLDVSSRHDAIARGRRIGIL
jgi:LuxR family transcriptional regulator, maltose regulon positive regulatory protein